MDAIIYIYHNSNICRSIPALLYIYIYIYIR